MKTIEITKSNIDKSKELLNSDKFVIVLYHWNECGHCIAFRPVWKSFTTGLNMPSASVEYSNLPLLPEKLRDIQAFPVIQVIKKGKIIDNYMGDRSEESLKDYSQKYIEMAAKTAKTAKDAKKETPTKSVKSVKSDKSDKSDKSKK